MQEMEPNFISFYASWFFTFLALLATVCRAKVTEEDCFVAFWFHEVMKTS